MKSAAHLIVGFCCLLLTVWINLSAQAEVTGSAEGGFVSSHELVLPVPPADVYRALTSEVSRWWDPAHSYSGDAGNFSLQAEAGGCFCEALPEGGSVMHMLVVYAAPGELLRLSGGLGPLQGMGVQGAMSFSLEAAGAGRTLLRYRYVVSGYAPEGLAGLADPVDRVQHGQLQRLAAYLAGEPL